MPPKRPKSVYKQKLLAKQQIVWLRQVCDGNEPDRPRIIEIAALVWVRKIAMNARPRRCQRHRPKLVSNA